MTPDDSRHGTRTGYVNQGCRCEPCTAANTREHKMYLLGYRPRLIDATGSKRRVQALIALGWTYAEVGAACGRMTRGWACYVVHGSGRIRSDIAADIAGAYERMSPRAPEGAYRDRGRRIAAAKDWVLPEAWADIDDPDEQPYESTPKQHHGPGRPKTSHERVEDAEWMADTDETLTGACARLGITPDGLWRACKREDRMDVYHRLGARENDAEMRANLRATKRAAA